MPRGPDRKLRAPQKHLYDKVRTAVESIGGQLLESEYHRGNTPMRYRCSCGKVTSSTWCTLRAKVRNGRTTCPSCCQRGRKRFDYEKVKDYFESQGCELLSTEYHHCQDKLCFKCSCGNVAEMRYQLFRAGKRCKKCAQRRAKKSYRKKLQIIAQDYFVLHGCALLDRYQDADTKMNFQCSCGNRDRVSWNRFRTGTRCHTCNCKKRQTLKQENVELYFQENNCELLDVFKDRYTPMSYRCKCGNVSQKTWTRFRSGNILCKQCQPKVQKPTIRTKRLAKYCRKLLGILKNGYTQSSHLMCYSGQELIDRLQHHPYWHEGPDQSIYGLSNI